jgi:hypothetical protein
VPRYRPPRLYNAKPSYYITRRAWFLMFWGGEMAVSDWLSPGAIPDRQLQSGARVQIENNVPFVWYPSGRAGLVLWPDGTTVDATPV